MFEVVGILVNGYTVCGVYKNNLMVRVGLKKYQESMSRPHTQVFDITGRLMAG